MFRQALRRLSFAAEVSALLYIASALVGLGLLYRAHSLGGPPIDLLSVLGIIAMPAIAALSLILACMGLPGLTGSLKLEFPVTMTLPLVYSGFQYMVVNLFLLSESQVVVQPAPFRSSEAWKDPVIVVIALLVQLLFLNATAVISGRKPASKVEG